MPYRLTFASLLALLLATLATVSSANAATFTVTGTGDTAPGTGCLGDQCPSVRAAVEAAAGTVEADTILLGANEYLLSNGQLVLGSEVTIVGVNARTTAIRGNNESFRVLAVSTNTTASLSRVTLRDGLALDENGGGFLAGGVVVNRGTLSLDQVRITGGRASSGGGLANLSGTVTITRSLIDGNTANLGGSDSGGLLNFNGGTLTVRHSTITGNAGNGGAGVFSWGDAGLPNTTTLEHVTLTGNVGTGVGFSGSDVMRLRGSIVAANSGPDCSAAVVSLGANLESATSCGLTGTGDLQSANPGFATDGPVDNGGDTDTFALAATSPAIDRAPDCTGTDQRGVVRPRGVACDAGAYEAGSPTLTITSAPASPTRETFAEITFTASPDTIRVACRHVFPDGSDEIELECRSPAGWRDLVEGTHRFELTPFGAGDAPGTPTVVTLVVDPVPPPAAAPVRTGDATFTFEATEPGATFACRLEGPSSDSGFVACSSPQAYAGLAAGDYRFTLRTLDAVGNEADAAPLSFSIAAPPPEPQPTATAVPEPVATPRPVATPTPTPQAGESVVARPVSGKILVKRPNSSEFVELRRSDGIPVGSEVNAKNGRVALTIEPGNGKPVQRAVFYAGIFKISQPGVTVDLTLSEPLAACKKAGAAQAKPKSRKLWGDGKGKFRTKGRYSAATVRGTIWLVQDSCEGTLTRVRQGVVSVRDSARRKTVLLRAGRSYLAQPRRR